MDRFPVTRYSVVWRSRSADPAERERAIDTLAAAYWRPVYKYIRLKWRAAEADAEDLTQGFFAKALERDFFQSYDADKASFRTYLRLCLDGFVSNERKAAGRQKRSAGAPLLSLDFESAEGELRQREIAAGGSVEDLFHREWVKGVYSVALDRFRTLCRDRGKTTQLAIFERYDLADSDTRVTYQELADAHSIAVTDVTNYLSWARREFRTAVLDALRELTATDREFRDEALAVLGRRL